MRTQAKHRRPTRRPHLLLLALGVPVLLATGPALSTAAAASDLVGAVLEVPVPAPAVTGPVEEVMAGVAEAVASPSAPAPSPAPTAAPAASPTPAPAAPTAAPSAAPTAAPARGATAAPVRPASNSAPAQVSGPSTDATSPRTSGTGVAAVDPARIAGGLLATDSLPSATVGGTGTAVLPPLLAAASPLLPAPELAGAPLPQAATPLALPLGELVQRTLPSVPAGLPNALVLGAALVALAAGAAAGVTALTEGRMRGRHATQ